MHPKKTLGENKHVCIDSYDEQNQPNRFNLSRKENVTDLALCDTPSDT